MSPLILTVAGAILLLVAIVVLTARRLKANSQYFDLGSVSQQWLLGHKDEG